MYPNFRLIVFVSQITLIVSRKSAENSATILYDNSIIGEQNLRNEEAHDLTLKNARYCRAPAKCEKLRFNTCMGVKLPYSSTSLDVVTNVENQERVQEKLSKWKSLIHIPRCWSVIQPFLCALYMPKCDNGLVDLPSREMCESIQSSCRILMTDNLWPDEFRCNVSYASSCNNEVWDLKFNTTGECKAPLVRATDEASFYEGVEGCGVQCNDPFFTEEERQSIKRMIKWGSTISCLVNAFAVLTFVINRPFGSKYPAQAVFWMNFCFLCVSLAFNFQFLGTNERIICHTDGTLRTSEPSRENVSCVTNFIMVYFFFIAGIVWLIIFAYTMLLRSQIYAQMKLRKNEWTAYYHMAAWSIPLILTVTIAALQQVDGDSLTGICFVGVVNKDMRLIFVLGPLLVSIVAWVFLAWCIIKLIRLKRSSEELMSERAKYKIQECICKLSAFLIIIVICTCITFYCQLYEWRHYYSWKKSFRSYVVCQLGVVGNIQVENCRMLDRPNFSLVQLQLFAIFAVHISVALWIFTTYSTIETWKQFIFKNVLRKQTEETGKLKKHEIIARAFEKRKFLNRDRLNSEGILSIDLHKSQQDPVGLDFELNSIESNENTSFAKTVPRLMIRRDGIKPVSHSSSGQWKNASDSEISFNITRICVESRRNSSESVVSIQSVQIKEKVREHPRTERRQNRRHAKRTKSQGDNLFAESNLDTEVSTAVSATAGHSQSNSIANTSRSMGIPSIGENSLELPNIALKVDNKQRKMIFDNSSFGLIQTERRLKNPSDDSLASLEQSEGEENESNSNSEDDRNLARSTLD